MKKKKKKKRKNDSERLQLAIGAGSSVAGASVGMLVAGPVGLLLGAAAPSALSAAFNFIGTKLNERRDRNVATLIALAAKFAELSVDDLGERLDSNPQKSEIFVRAIKAAQDSAILPDLVALAMALSNTAISDNALDLHAEASFVRAIEQLDSAHVQMLNRFVMTANQNNLGDGSVEFDTPVQALNVGQLELAMPEYSSHLVELIAGLQSHGLVTLKVSDGGAAFYGGGGGNSMFWSITDVGRAFLERIAVVGEMLKVEDED